MAHNWSKPGMPARLICGSPRLLRDAATVALLCVAGIAVAQSTPQNASASVAHTPMSSSELASELSGVKDNSLVVADKIISGPLKLDATQQPIPPIAFKVEFRDCEFADEVFVQKVNFGQSVIFSKVKFDKGLNLEHVSIKGDLQLVDVHSGKIIKLNQSQVDGDVRIKDPDTPGLEIESLTAGNLIVAFGKGPFSTLDFAHLSAGRLSLSSASAVAEVNLLNLNNVNLKETLALQNLDLQRVTAEELTVAKRTLFLSVTTIKKQLNLNSAELQGFEWRFAGPVQFPENLNIDGASFGN